MRAFLLFALAAPGFGASLHFGAVAGVPVTEYFDTGAAGSLHGGARYTAATRRYTAGAAMKWRGSGRLGLELDVLYKRMGYVGYVNTFGNGAGSEGSFDAKGSSWEFPLLAKYGFGRRARPFLAGGGVLRYVGPVRARGTRRDYNLITGTSVTSAIDTTSPSDLRKRLYPGLAAGGGVELGAGRFRLVPQIRYTRWTANIAGERGVLRFGPNQVEFLVGFTF